MRKVINYRIQAKHRLLGLTFVVRDDPELDKKMGKKYFINNLIGSIFGHLSRFLRFCSLDKLSTEIDGVR